METGWSATWVAAALGLRARNTSGWALATAPGAMGVDVAALLQAWCPVFLPGGGLCADAAFVAVGGARWG